MGKPLLHMVTGIRTDTAIPGNATLQPVKTGTSTSTSMGMGMGMGMGTVKLMLAVWRRFQLQF